MRSYCLHKDGIFVQTISHFILKLVPANTKIIFSVPQRLSELTPFNSSFKKGECHVNHRTRTNDSCRSHVVYSIPLTCGSCYIGQTERCVNIRLAEHRRASASKSPRYNLTDHLDECGCSPIFDNTVVLHSERKQINRLCLESMCIYSDKNCISDASLALSQRETAFLTPCI